MNETQIRDKAIEDCVKELIRKAEQSKESSERNARTYGANDPTAMTEMVEAVAYQNAARHLLTMKSDSPIMQMMKDFRG